MTVMYPELKIARIKSPNRFYAVPLLGFLAKFIITIPVDIELWALGVAQFFVSMFNSFYIFFKGKYWKNAYALNLGIMKIEMNLTFFLWGLTDTYPNMNFKTTDYTVEIDYNKKPNRVFATPLLGVIMRFVMLIPFGIYSNIVSIGAFIAILISWFDVLFKKRYPETTYEIARDSVRIEQATKMYYLGMSDNYPSWQISMNHQTLKVLLLVAGAIIAFYQLNNQVQSIIRVGERFSQQSQYQLQPQPKANINYNPSTPSASYSY